ncbi:glucose-6-phosphate isomerase [Candidatus Phytoplasma sacchari]|nr:glucose-6-phosphate isomerase [Candidatus Phytoplasma sacchari]KAB8122701.1 glucose-6-phosphate isomerase [Candidatus Phytoplasma sacchari]
MKVKLKIDGIKNFFNWKNEKNEILDKLKDINSKIDKNEEIKKKYLGSINLPINFDFEEINKIKKIKEKLKGLDILVVIGIGGSFLGTKAGIEFVKKPFFKKNKTEIIFAGHQVSGTYLKFLIKYLKDKNWAINVISKSGTTLEPILSFRFLKKEIEKKYGSKESKKRVFVTTSNNKNLLFNIASLENYEKFFIPDEIIGRFSVLTNVGFLPFIFAGLKVESMIEGAKKALEDTTSENLDKNMAYKYAAIRYILFNKLDKKIELFVNYEPQLFYFTEWLKQLFMESEGKDNKGIFISASHNSTDLHSLGQFIQNGSKILFETILNINSNKKDFFITKDEKNLDKLNYLSGKYFSYINNKILKSTKLAHIEGNVPNLEIIFKNLDEYNFGYLVFFFQRVSIISSFLFNVNPFNQPGVELYKSKLSSFLKCF